MNDNPISDPSKRRVIAPSERLPVELLWMRYCDGGQPIRLRVRKTAVDATPAQQESAFESFGAFWVVRYGDLAAIGSVPALAFDEFDYLFHAGIDNAESFRVESARDPGFAIVAYRRM